jgi:carbamoylphosphate synthase large subunit
LFSYCTAEANGGPLDTDFLFSMFMSLVRGRPQSITAVDSRYLTARSKTLNKVLVIGSGGLSIGQAGEFDFSCSQAIKALKEEGVEIILLNPNIASIQTSKGMADKVYFLPVTHQFALEIIKKERPEGILMSMGGQTALSVGLALEASGDLARFGVRVLGTPVSTVRITEDRELFAKALDEIGERVAQSGAATNVEEALTVANNIGYPVLVRAAYALGGLGSGFADNAEELATLATRAFTSSAQILIDQDLRGWKEIEIEVVRDASGNCITVCAIENVDACGVHTGESAVVAPCQTLSNSEMFMLRSAAQKVMTHVGIVGEANIQFALAPDSEKYFVIEVNARLSRSSALASKATGYPLAYVATKLALGHNLVSLRNSVTKTTTACVEPALDYCVVKLPRWDLKKFAGVDKRIGSAMKSVGEVMAIGRTFEEALSKAVRMVNPALDGFGVPATFAVEAKSVKAPNHSDSSSAKSSPPASPAPVTVSKSSLLRGGLPPTLRELREVANDDEEFKAVLDTRLHEPSDTRLYDIAVALACGYTVDRIHELTQIDRWFLSRMRRIVCMEIELEAWGAAGGVIDNLPLHVMQRLKQRGFSDRQIARRLNCTEDDVRSRRLSLNLLPVVKQIDTLAAEFPAYTNYLYMTYNGTENDVVASSNLPRRSISDTPAGDAGQFHSNRATASSTPPTDPIIVLGCGPYSIGTSVEYDWASVGCVRTLRSNNIPAIMINCNPETVSTDYDEADKLYFEELSMERVLDICAAERATGVIVSVGGQIPQNLALPLHRRGIKILGTSPVDIDRAEDRKKFSALCDAIGVDQPPWRELTSVDDAFKFADTVGYPVLIRPSYVLSGAAMRVAEHKEQLRAALLGAAVVSPDHPVVISKFIMNAKEIEFDGVAREGVILNYATSEHVENAGLHGGDATLLLPAQKLWVETIRQVKKIAQAIARALNISGPFNLQLMAVENEVKVIECNLRASRTFPFISRAFDFNFISLATRIMADLPVKPGTFSLLDIDYVVAKAPQFSFKRLSGADPALGVEMVSTGEVACLAPDAYEAFLLAIMSAGFRLPNRTRNILVTVSDSGKVQLLETCRRLATIGYHLHATGGTYAFLKGAGIPDVIELAKPGAEVEGGPPNVLKLLQAGKLDLVINDAEAGDRDRVTGGFLIRRAAIDFGVSLITNVKAAMLLGVALERVEAFHIRSIEEFHSHVAGGVGSVPLWRTPATFSSENENF